MIVFDSEAFAPADRIDAHRAFAQNHVSPCDLLYDRTEAPVRMRQEIEHFGPVVWFSTTGTGFRTRRTARHIRQTTQGAVSVITQRRGSAGYVWRDHQQSVPESPLVLSDRTESHTYGWTGTGCSQAVMVDTALLALPEDVVRAAVPRVSASPLTPLLLHQVQVLNTHAGPPLAGAAARALGHSTLELIRALIMSVADDGPLRRAVADRSLLDRVLAYVSLHLADQDLTPQRIAAAHHISVRALYRLCGDAGISLEQEIITHRLTAVRRSLENPADAHRTITALAYAQGFTDMAFFSRRFRRAYSRTPTEHRRLASADRESAPTWAN